MKYIIVGLGSFGSSLAIKLTEMGNEVIGVDTSMKKIDDLKDKISHAVCIDATDQFTITGLPLKDTDVVVVAIGEDQGANVMVTAIFKNQNVKRLISRAINPLHENVLQALGVDEIVHPEEETAERWAKKLCLRGVVDSFELGSDYSIVEASVPQHYVGKTLQEIDIRRKHNLLILTTIKKQQIDSKVGKSKIISKVMGVLSPDEVLETGDLLVLFGSNKDINAFLRTH